MIERFIIDPENSVWFDNSEDHERHILFCEAMSEVMAFEDKKFFDGMELKLEKIEENKAV